MDIKNQLQNAYDSINPNEKVVILYHSRCPDGIVAMDVVRKRFRNSVCIPLCPNNLPRDSEIDGQIVISVDLFQNKDNIIYMCGHASHLYYIDHHPRDEILFTMLNLTIIHTLDHSAAGIVSLLNPQKFITNLIEPNDLGKFDDVKDDDNLMYNAWYDRYWKQGDLTSSVAILRWCMDGSTPALRQDLIKEGAENKKEKDKYFKKCMDNINVRYIHGHEIAFCRSDKDKGVLSNYIRDMVDQDIVCVWGWGSVGKFYTSSWRSTTTDLNTFLKNLGGGGHAHAAGLKILVGKETELLGVICQRKEFVFSLNAFHIVTIIAFAMLGGWLGYHDY